MKKLTSQTLEALSKALGISGPMSPVTELADAVVDQVLDVGPIVRRSRTQGQTDGLYTCMMRNVHAAADSRTSSLLPFNPGTNALAPYPTPMPRGFDVWLLSAFVTQLSGSGTLSAALRVDYPGAAMGLSTVSLPSGTAQNVAFWNTIVVESSTFGTKSGTTTPMQKIGMRLIRSPTTAIVFASTSSALATFDCFLVVGVFPVGLGQDAVV